MEKITARHPLSHSEDIVKQNTDTLKALFPTIVKEGKIDIGELKALLGEDVEENEEYYRFTWAGKSQARQEANKPSTGTLRPNKADSKDWDTTQNIFIEGDNLEVLKLLQKSYVGKVKMIYIDPPYNTGKDFVYKDNYKDNLSNYLSISGQIDEEGNKLGTNSDTDGRYHSNWLDMMYPRLKLARNLLKDDGVIFISIDDNESNNLRKICDEIFGEENFIADVCVVNNLKGRNDKRYIATANERLLMYVKSDLFEESGLRISEVRISEFDQEDSLGRYRLLGLRKRGGADTRDLRPKMFFPIYINPQNGDVSLIKDEDFSIEVFPRKSDGKDGCWRWGWDTVSLRIKSLIGRPVNGGAKWDVFERDYLETDGELRRIKPKSVFSGTSFSTDRATKEYRAIMGDADFSSPKSVSMISDLIEYSVVKDSADIVMDFFAGSGTTAHAVMRLNTEDLGNRRSISVQLPEPIDINTQTFKNGYKTIADITKERLRRAEKDIRNNVKSNLFNKESVIDFGFKAFKLDTSNINTWDGSMENFEENLFTSADNLKKGRTEEDILYEILLKSGLDLSQQIEEKAMDGKKVYNIGLGALIICLADNISTAVAEGIGQWKAELNPATCTVIFKDAGLTDVEKANSIQILKRYGITEVNSI